MALPASRKHLLCRPSLKPRLHGCEADFRSHKSIMVRFHNPFMKAPNVHPVLRDGNDGPWSTFAIRVGTPFQTLRVLASTAVPETWVIDPLGCSGDTGTHCMNARGLLFDNSTSTSWQEEGLYVLGAETNLPYTENYDRGNYGYDTLGLGYTGSGSDDYQKQVVASIATSDFYVGHLGLNPQSINFTTQNDPSPSLLTTLKTTNRIPSLSYGYSAGAEYREPIPALCAELSLLTLACRS